MSEKKLTSWPPSLGHSKKQSPQTEQLEQQQRTTTLRHVTLIATSAASIFIALFLLLYWQQGKWQLLLQSGVTAIAVMEGLAALRLTRRGKLDATGILLLFGLATTFCAGELVWDGATWYLLVGVMLMLLLVGSITLPHRPDVWGSAALLSGTAILVLNWLQPIPRYDISQSAVLAVSLPGVFFLMVLGTLWQILHLGTTTIRTRLLIAFVALATLPMSTTSTVSSILHTRETQERVIARLESVARLKEIEIQTWLETLDPAITAHDSATEPAVVDGLHSIVAERSGLGESGKAYLVSRDRVLLATSQGEGILIGETRIDNEGVHAALRTQGAGFKQYLDGAGASVIGVFRWLPQLQAALMLEQDRSESLHAALVTLRLNIAVTVLSALAAIMAGLLITRSIAAPLARLTTTAGRIAAGHLELEVSVEREDEVGMLSRAFNRMTVRLRELIASLEQRIAERERAKRELQQSFTEIQRLKNQLQSENVYLREEIKLEHNFDEIIGQSNTLKYLLFTIEQVAATDTLVLITGESGTGKELVARAVHETSSRSDRPLVKVNCAALPSHLIESELFGHEKGAFTGADAKRIGRFELADGATLFLDEIGELPLELQPKLLRAIQEGEFERLGSSRTIKVNVRLIAATNRDLEEEIRAGRFREDLFYRLNVFPLSMPPLRERAEDIPMLVRAFVQTFNKKLGKQIETIPQRAMDALQQHAWPGNVRELQNVIERSVITTPDSILRVELSATAPTSNPNFQNTVEGPSHRLDELPAASKTLDEVEREYICRILDQVNWKISGPNGAAHILGLNPSTLRFRMRKLSIKRP